MVLQELFDTGDAEPADDGDATEQRILDAALDEVARRGTSGTTMEAVAATAKVGRMTVFRRFGSKDALLLRLTRREVRRFLRDVDECLAPLADPADRVVEAFVLCLKVTREHPVLRVLPPGVLLEELRRGTPSALDLGRAFVAARLDHPEADEVADVLVRLATSYGLQPGPLTDDGAARAFARRRLAPLLYSP